MSVSYKFKQSKCVFGETFELEQSLSASSDGFGIKIQTCHTVWHFSSVEGSICGSLSENCIRSDRAFVCVSVCLCVHACIWGRGVC